MKIKSRNSINTFFKNIWNKHLPNVSNRIDLFNLKSYKPFFILTNLKKENGKFRYLLKNVISEPLFLICAYKTIPNATIGLTSFSLINKITLNRIDIDWFLNISQKLKKDKFCWSFNRRAFIRKMTSSKKALDIGSPMDKIVLKAIYLVFLEIYENKLKQFSDYSHGFRLDKNCHSALHQIKFGWNNINWYLEFDLKKICNSIKRDKLIELIKTDIQDQSLFTLLYKIFKIKNWNKKEFITYFSTVQTNVLLPLFLNIYLTPLDKYSKTLIKIYNSDKRLKKNFKYDKLIFLTKEEKFNFSLDEIKLKLEQLKKISKGISKYMHDINFTRVRYCKFSSVRELCFW